MSTATRFAAGLPVLLLLACSATDSAAAEATTYYVRTDGGSAQQCDGTANAPVPDAGAAGIQRCAWQHPFIALPPSQPPRIAGGDTLVIHAGSYAIGIGAPETGACAARDAPACLMGSIPGGPSPARPTRILGVGHDAGCPRPPQLWANGGARAILSLHGGANFEIACLELTDHSPCIKSHNHAGNAKGETSRCRSDAPFGSWGENGVVASDASNVVLRQLDIHGLAANGVNAGRLKDWTLDRVILRANGWAGWDGNISQGKAAGSSNSGRIQFLGGEIAWNGCSERYPGTDIFGCWAQQQGGYGDGLGTTESGGDWLLDGVRIHHNTSDGLDLLYMDGSGSVTLRRLWAEGNAGNQIKTAGPTLLENSIVLGNCAFFATLPTSNLGDEDHCRAMGNALSVSHLGNSLATIRHNTLTGQGDCLLITVGGKPGARTLVQNNAFIGDDEWRAGLLGGGRTCGHYAEDSPAGVVFENNLFWQLKRDQCPAGSLCGLDPLLTSTAYGHYDATPRAGSPLIDSAIPIAGLDQDYHGKPRPGGSRPDIGAIEVQDQDGPAPPPRPR